MANQLALIAGSSTPHPPPAPRKTPLSGIRSSIGTPVQFALYSSGVASAGDGGGFTPTLANVTIPSYIGSPKTTARMAKAKEIDSGKKEWETVRKIVYYDGQYVAPDLTTSAPVIIKYRNLKFSDLNLPDLTKPFINELQPALHTTLPKHLTVNFFRTELEEAQRHYAADACVFVGNLANHYSDLELTLIVLADFSRYGQVYGAVGRIYVGGNVKPYAILQFTDAQDAQHAVLHAEAADPKGHKIGDRYLRTELSQVNRTITTYLQGVVTPNA